MLGLWDVNCQAPCRYHQKARFLCLLVFLVVVLACVTCLEGGSPQCVPTNPLHHVTLQGGIAAGDYVKIGPVVSATACANICCKDTKCDLAFMANNVCYNLHCYSAKLCHTRPARESRFVVSVTFVKRGIGDDGRTILDRPTLGNVTSTHTHGENGTKLNEQKSNMNKFVHSNNTTQSTIFESSGSSEERTKGPSINGNSQNNYIQNSTRSTFRNSTNLAKKKLHYFDKAENGESSVTTFTPSQGNFSQQENQTNESTKMVYHSKTPSRVMVAWRNDSHVLVKEIPKASLNGTGGRNSTVRSNTTFITTPKLTNSTSKDLNFTTHFAKTDILTTTNISKNESSKEKEKLDEQLLDKSFYNVNSSGIVVNSGDHGNASESNETEFSFTNVKKGILKGKSFKSQENGTQLDISSPTSSVLAPSSKYTSKTNNTLMAAVKTNDSSSETSLSVEQQSLKTRNCRSSGVLYNKTLIAGLKSGDFTDYGKVQTMENCVGFCCVDKKCDMALMLGTTCYTLHCASPSLCKVRPAHPSALNPRISFIYRDTNTVVKDDQDKQELHQTATPAKQVSKRVKGSRCKHGAIQHGVTLQNGQKAGIFKLRLTAKDMDSCLDMCCKDKTCNVAFLIDASCYSVRCHSHEDCTIKKAKSTSARSVLSVVRSRILPLNDKRQQIPRVEKKYTTIINITNQHFTKPLGDFESLEFLNLAERIQVAVSTVLAAFKGYKESEVISFEPSPLMTKLQLTLYDGAPIKEMLLTIVKAIKGGKMESSIDGSVLTFLVSTSGFKFYTPQGLNLVCDPEFNYDVHWKLTVFNFQTTSPCPRKAQGETRRSCHGSDKTNATWGFPSFVQCVSSEYKTLHSKVGNKPSHSHWKCRTTPNIDLYPTVRENGEWQLSNGDCTAEKNYGFLSMLVFRIKNLRKTSGCIYHFKLNCKAKTFAEGAKKKTPFQTLHSQLGITPSGILIRIQKLTFVDTYRALLDKPHNTTNTNTTTLHDGPQKSRGQQLKHSNATVFANKSFSIPSPDDKKKTQPIPFKLVSKQKLDNSSNQESFSPLNSLPHSTNATTSDKVFPKVQPQATTANVSSNSTLFSDIFPQAANANKFSRMNIPRPLTGKIAGKPIAASKSIPVKPFSRNQVSYGNVPLVGSQEPQNSVGIPSNKINNILNKNLDLPFKKGFPYSNQQQQQQQKPVATGGVTNPRYNLGYPQKQLNQFGKTSPSDTSGAVRSSYPTQWDTSKNLIQNQQSPYAAYKQQLQRLRASQASHSSLFNKQTEQNVQNWQSNQYRNTYGSPLGRGSQGDQAGQTNGVWQNAQRLQGNQAWQGYPGTGLQGDQASFPGYSSMTGYPGTSFQSQPDSQTAPQMDIGRRRRKRDLHTDELTRAKRQGGNMVWYNNYNLRNQVYRPSPTSSEDDQEPFLTNVQTGYDNPKDMLNQQDPLSYNVDYFHRPTPYYSSATYSLGTTHPSPTRAATSESQSEFGLFPTSGVTEQASTRGSFSSPPSLPGREFPAGFTDLQEPLAIPGKSNLAGFGQPQVQQEFVPTNKPFAIPISTTKRPYFMKQTFKVLSPTMSPLTTTQAIYTVKSVLNTKPSSKPSTASLKPTGKPSIKVTQSSTELLRKKLMDMIKNKGTEKPVNKVAKHDATVMEDVYREKNRAPMFGGDIALIVDTLRQLSLYSKYTNPPETVDTLKQFLQVGSHILDKRNKHEWKYLTKESHSTISALDAAEVVETYSRIVAGKLHPDDMKKPILTTNIMVALKSVDLMAIDSSQDIQFPNYSHPAIVNWTDATDKLVLSPRSLVNALQDTPSKQSVQLVSCNVRKITDLLPRSLVANTFGNDSIIGGHVISVSASPSLGDAIDPPIKIVLNNVNKDVSTFEQKCVYWEKGSSPGSGRWSSHGCRFVESNLTHTTCECTHMSTFSFIADTAKPKATVPATVPPTAAPPPEEEGTNILYILLGILGLLLILFIILVIICFIIKRRRKRQNESKDSSPGRQGSTGGRRSTARSDDSISTGSGEFDEMLASRRRNVHPERKSASADSPRWQRMRKNGENPEDLMLKEKSYLMSDYHQPYNFSSSKSPPPSDSSSHRNRSRSS